MKNILIKTKNKGFAILFTIVIVGIISSITIGLSNSAYKQTILSSVARDSTTAFYEADIASECALYADNLNNMTALPSNIPECLDNLSLTSDPSTTDGDGYVTTKNYINPSSPLKDSQDKCFGVSVVKTETVDRVNTTINAMGYNICNKNNLRTVERFIEVDY